MNYNNDDDDDDDGKYGTRHSCCTGVEVHHTTTGAFITCTATHDVILCTGTIVSPVLLLNAGIGRSCPSSHSTPGDSNTTTKSTGSTTIPLQRRASDRAAVGCHLQDHVLLPRVLLTCPDISPTALNGVRAMTNLLLRPNHNDTTKSNSNNDNESSPHSITTKTQINLMDSAAYWDLIPIMGAAPFRFQLRRTKDHNETKMGKLYYTLIVAMVNSLLYLQYHAMQILLHLLIHYTPIYYVAKYCIKVVAIFVMNGESNGSLTVSPKDDSPEGTDTTGIRRLRDVNIHINLGYLSHPNDLERFRRAFAASIDVYEYRSAFRTICEVFPGPLIWSHTTTTAATNNVTPSPVFHNERFDFIARSMVLPYFHWIGTCAMKMKKKPTTKSTESTANEVNNNDDDDDAWVVDEFFRVRGVDHLRVCDASIFPSLISAPTALTCAALGYILANMIVDEIVQEDASKMKKRE